MARRGAPTLPRGGFGIREQAPLHARVLQTTVGPGQRRGCGRGSAALALAVTVRNDGLVGGCCGYHEHILCSSPRGIRLHVRCEPWKEKAGRDEYEFRCICLFFESFLYTLWVFVTQRWYRAVPYGNKRLGVHPIIEQ